MYTIILAFVGIASVYGTKLSIQDYLRQHAELSPLTDEPQQQTQWDRTLMLATRDLTYPVENHPVPEVRVHLLGEEKKQRKRPKTRERRQISSDSCYLLFSNRVHLVQMQNVPSLQIGIVLTGFQNVVAVDFDKSDGFLFFSDTITRTIYRSRVDGSGITVLVNTNITTPDGIAWDWVSKKLYWTDADDNDLEVYDPSTMHRKVLFRNGPDSNPRAIVLDPSTRCMYWTDWGTPPTIERASMDGTNRTVLHNTTLQWPNALTIDYDNQILYWLDAGLDRLERSNTNGSGRLLLSTVDIYHPFSATFYEGHLFWSDWGLNALLGARLNGISAVNIVLGDLTLDPMGVTAACASRQANVPNACDGRCEGKLCLLSKSEHRGYSCNCPDESTPPPPSIAAVLRCELSCGEHGVCTGHNYCACNDGWRGDTCDRGVCTTLCMHGDCIGPNECVCDDDWAGESCDRAVCCPGCVRGTCSSPGLCTCPQGWGGPLCDQQTCIVEGGCLNGGSCKYSSCDCPNNYVGDRCQKIRLV